MGSREVPCPGGQPRGPGDRVVLVSWLLHTAVLNFARGCGQQCPPEGQRKDRGTDTPTSGGAGSLARRLGLISYPFRGRSEVQILRRLHPQVRRDSGSFPFTCPSVFCCDSVGFGPGQAPGMLRTRSVAALPQPLPVLSTRLGCEQDLGAGRFCVCPRGQRAGGWRAMSSWEPPPCRGGGTG